MLTLKAQAQMQKLRNECERLGGVVSYAVDHPNDVRVTYYLEEAWAEAIARFNHLAAFHVPVDWERIGELAAAYRKEIDEGTR